MMPTVTQLIFDGALAALAITVVAFLIIEFMTAFYFQLRQALTAPKRDSRQKPTHKPPLESGSSSRSYNDVLEQKLKRVRDLSTQQVEWYDSVQAPSAGALHSKQKSDAMNKIKAIEEEKVSILQSIIDDGHNPVLTTLDPATGEVREAKLSTILAQLKERKGDNVPAPPASEKKAKLKLIKGSSDDDDFDSDDGKGKPTH